MTALIISLAGVVSPGVVTALVLWSERLRDRREMNAAIEEVTRG